MTRSKLLFAVVFVAAIVALVAGSPAAQAQTSCGSGCSVHFVGAGSSAQFSMAAIAADQAALNANASVGGTIKHWTKKYKASTGDGAYLSDNRNAKIVNQTGNVWVVWIENSSGAVTDIWTDVSVDSTVGVRCVLAQETGGSGCQIQITSANGTGGDNTITGTLWPDGETTDSPIDLAAIDALNTSVGGGQHVNVGLTDIRPEDASYATNRTLATLNTTTWAGLGYALGTSGTGKLVGNNIATDQGTGSFAQPVQFALPGKKDPFNSTHTVPTSFVTLPIGAAPIVFVTNNGGTPAISNLVSGVTPDEHAGTTSVAGAQTYPLAHLYDGSTNCDTSNAAFGGNGSGSGTPLTLFQREPLSGTMNTTEFNLFRTFDNTDDTQEKGFGVGVTAVPCSSTTSRERSIGTSEVVGSSSPAYGILGTPNSLGYFFTGWSNYNKYGNSANFNYLTIDGIDPIFAAPGQYNVCVGGSTPGAVCGANESCGTGTCQALGTTSQTVPECLTAKCSSDIWPAYTLASGGTYPAGASFPNVRYGLYKAWSIYRWIALSTSDPYGPSEVAQEAQNYVDADVADFIPFEACAPGAGNGCFSTTGPVDGLAVFRSHFTPTGVTLDCGFSTTLSNGSVTSGNGLDGGNTLGGGIECGGDVGGLEYGPFGTTSPARSYVTWKAGTETKNKGWALTWKTGDEFNATTDVKGNAITLTCTDTTGAQTVTQTTIGFYTSATSIYVLAPNPDTNLNIECFAVAGNTAHAAATTTQDGSTYHSKHE